MSNKNMKVGLEIQAKTSGMEKIAQGIGELEKAGGKVDELKQSMLELAKAQSDTASQQALIDSFRKLKQESTKTADSIEKAQQRVSKLASANKKNTEAFDKAVAKVKRLKKQHNQLAESTQKARKALSDAGISTKNLAGEQSRLSNEAKKTQNAIGNLAAKVKTFTKNSGDLATTAQKSQQSMTPLSRGVNAFGNSCKEANHKIKALIASMGGFVVFRTAKGYIEDMVGTGARFEQLRAQLTALTGSAENADKSLAWIKEFAKNTPSDIESVTASFVKMKAFGLDPMDGSYQSLVDQTAKLGFSQEKLDGIVLAVGQAWTKQKLQGEEALQLIERGVPVWDLLAKATGKSVVELQKLSSAGKLGRKEIRMLIEEMGRSSQGAAQAQMSTWNGLVSNLKDVWLDFQNTVAESGALDYFKKQLDDLLTKTKAMAADGSLKRYAKQISDGIIRASEAVKGFAQTLVNLTPVIKAAAVALVTLKFAQLTSNVVSASAAIKGKFIGALTTTTAATTKATSKAGFLSTAIRGIGGALSLLKVNLVVAVATALGVGLYKAVNSLIPKTHEWQQSVDKAFNSLIALQTKAAQGIEINTGDLTPFNEQMAEIDRQIEELANKDTGVFDFAKDAIPWLDSNNQQLIELLQKKDELKNQEIQLNAQIKANETAETQRAEKAKAHAEEQKQIAAENIALLEKRKAELESLGETESDYYKYVVSELNTLNKTLDDTASKARQAFEAAGLSISELFTGITGSEQSAIDSLQNGVNYINSLGLSAKQTGAMINRFLGGSLKALKTPEGITAAISELEKLENKTPAVNEKLKALRRQLMETSPAFKALADGVAKATSVEQVAEWEDKINAALQKGKISAEEAAAAFADVKDKTVELAEAGKVADEKSAKSKTAKTEATKTDTEATKENTESTKKAGSASAELARQTMSVRNSYAASKKAVERFDEALKSQFAKGMSLSHYWNAVTQAAQSARMEYEKYEEDLKSVAYYTDILSEKIKNNTISQEDLAAATSTASGAMEQLNESELSQLNSQIDAARNKLQSLEEQAKKTAQSVADRLADATGSETDKINRRFEREIEDLQSKSAKSNVGSADYERAISDLRKLQQIELDKQQKREQERIDQERRRKVKEAQEAAREVRESQPAQSQPFDINAFGDKIKNREPIKIDSKQMVEDMVRMLNENEEQTIKKAITATQKDIIEQIRARNRGMGRY